MNKFLIIAVLLLLTGIIFFGIAGYCYRTIINLRELFAYYSLDEEVYMSHPKNAAVFADLWFGIVKFSILGVVAWILSLIFFWKRNNKVLTNK